MYFYLLLTLYLNLSQRIVGTDPIVPPADTSSYGNVCKTPDSKLGECVPLESCPYLHEQTLKKGSDANVNISEWNCSSSFQNSGPLVCCAIDEGCGTREISPDTNIEPIIDGVPASPGEWPWMVALLLESEPPEISCGATLISRRWILTAAHCFEFNTWKSVRLGALNLNGGVDEPIERVIRHPKFDFSVSLQYDIALIQLRNTVNFTKNIRHICLPNEAKLQNDSYYNGARPTVIGWGENREGHTQMRLQKAELEMVNSNDCAKRYSNLTPPTSFRIDHRTLCTLKDFKGSCDGDSGGPLNFPEKNSTDDKHTRYFIGGIVSGSRKCGLTGLPRVYTKVAAFMDWIYETMTNKTNV